MSGVPTFLSLKKQYSQLWRTLEIKTDWRSKLDAAANKIILNRDKYLRVEAETGVPWYVVGVIHMRESNNNFSTHLHNGDSLKARTWRVPRGRPLTGKAPFDWYFSASDALKMKDLHKLPGWDIETILYQLERYNGFGYRRYHSRTLSPYLWQGTGHYCDADSACGKYVADGKYSATTADVQCGTAAVLKVLEQMGYANFAVKVPVTEAVKESPAARSLIGVVITTVIGFFAAVGEVIGRWLEVLPGTIDETEMIINTTGKVATWLGVPISVWVTGGLALSGVLLALWRVVRAAQFKIPAADTERV